MKQSELIDLSEGFHIRYNPGTNDVCQVAEDGEEYFIHLSTFKYLHRKGWVCQDGIAGNYDIYRLSVAGYRTLRREKYTNADMTELYKGAQL